MYNSYSDLFEVVEDELVFKEVRISGDDLWTESLDRGMCVVGEIVSQQRIKSTQFRWGQLAIGSVVLACAIAGTLM